MKSIQAMGQTQSEGNFVSSLLGRQDTSSPRFRIIQGAHESFVESLETSLSSFLQSEIPIRLGEISVITLGDFIQTIPSPGCFILMRLHPRPDTMILRFDSASVFTLLELLLGGKGGTPPAEPRELTEIEWSLLEEVVRVIVRPLGIAWRTFHETEFEVGTLGSDPSLLPCPDATRPMIRIVVQLQFGEQAGSFEIAAPQAFFEAAAPAEQKELSGSPSAEDLERNLALLEDAVVELEVRLQGPTLEFEDLIDLKPGQVLTFDYPLRKPLHALVNGDVTVEGYIVSAGRKRAFQIEEPV
jgi:flagellar motor switch protein FliM